MCYLSTRICQYVHKLAVKLKTIQFFVTFHYAKFENETFSCAVCQGDHDGLNWFCIVFGHIGEKIIWSYTNSIISKCWKYYVVSLISPFDPFGALECMEILRPHPILNWHRRFLTINGLFSFPYLVTLKWSSKGDNKMFKLLKQEHTGFTTVF